MALDPLLGIATEKPPLCHSAYLGSDNEGYVMFNEALVVIVFKHKPQLFTARIGSIALDLQCDAKLLTLCRRTGELSDDEAFQSSSPGSGSIRRKQFNAMVLTPLAFVLP